MLDIYMLDIYAIHVLYEEAPIRCDLADFCFLSVESSEDLFPEDPSCDRLTFYHFDVSRLLKHGASLLGSAGAEFELQDDKAGLDLLQPEQRGLMLEQPFNLAEKGESCSYSDGLRWFSLLENLCRWKLKSGAVIQRLQVGRFIKNP